jgi:DNA polymerase III delta subunit
MIYVLLGPDRSLVRVAARQRARASDASGEETTTLDGATSSLQDVLMAVASVGFFSAGRTIVVENLIQRHGKGAAAEWSALFAGVPDSSTLILADASVSSLPAAVKKALPQSAEVVLGDPPRGRDLVEWAVGRAKASGGKLDRGVAQKLVQTIYPTSWAQKARNAAFDRPPDLEALGNEIDKLVSAALPGEVSEWHIQQLVAAGDSDQVFTFLDAAAAGNLRQATVELDKLLAAGEDPYKVLSQLASAVELSAVMSLADRRDPVEVGRDLKLPNANRMTSIARTVRDQPRGFAPLVARVLEEVDRQMKTGELRNPVDALYTALTRIAALRSPVTR